MKVMNTKRRALALVWTEARTAHRISILHQHSRKQAIRVDLISFHFIHFIAPAQPQQHALHQIPAVGSRLGLCAAGRFAELEKDLLERGLVERVVGDPSKALQIPH